MSDSRTAHVWSLLGAHHERCGQDEAKVEHLRGQLPRFGDGRQHGCDGRGGGRGGVEGWWESWTSGCALTRVVCELDCVAEGSLSSRERILALEVGKL